MITDQTQEAVEQLVQQQEEQSDPVEPIEQPESDLQTEDETEEVLEEAEEQEEIEETEEESEDDETLPEVFAYKADGVDYEVSPEEATKLMSMGHNYNTRSQELAKQTQSVEEREVLVSDLGQVRTNYFNALDQLDKSINDVGYTPEQLLQLSESDPAEYNRINAHKVYNQECREAINQARLLGEQEQLETQKKQVISEWNDTLRHYPQLKDPKVYGEYKSLMKDYGLTDADIDQVYSKRFFDILNDARIGREMKSKKKIASKKVINAPRVNKTGRSQERSTKNQVVLSQLQNEHKQSGSVLSAVQLLSAQRGS